MYSLPEMTLEFFDNLLLNNRESKEENDSERLCLKNAVKKFLKTGKKEDAFSVYFCFCEIYKLFGNGYENTKRLLELLSDHEYHSGELLSKHRDHYSHSVYVFALGLAIFENDPGYRNVFNDFYHHNDKESQYDKFLKLWGIVALFHDIGYPFQLAHEQIQSYLKELWPKNNDVPFVSYKNIDIFVTLNDYLKEKINGVLGDETKIVTIHDLLAYGVHLREKYDFKTIKDKLDERASNSPKFMDHGYFSAVLLAKKLFETDNFAFGIEELDVLTAILLHNSLNKFDLKSIENYHSISCLEHPLAYLIILCDELQVWDRLAYGKESKNDPIAWNIMLNIKGQLIETEYWFDTVLVRNPIDGSTKINKSYLEMTTKENPDDSDNIFIKKIYGFVGNFHKITVRAIEKKKKKNIHKYLSDDNFINLCVIAAAIHSSYYEHFMKYKPVRIHEEFAKLPLEFKCSNIEQAKSYAEKLETINCFYSRKDLDYPEVTDFRDLEVGRGGYDNIGFLSREEHIRWVREKIALGWKYGTDYKDINERNKKRIHKCILPFDLLSKEEQEKDELMVLNTFKFLKHIDPNMKVYRYYSGAKPDLVVGGVGHRFFTDEPERLKERVKEILLKYSETNRVIVRTCYANGADLLIAECANELGLTTKAILPMPYEDYINDVRLDAIKHGHEFGEKEETKMRNLLAQTATCKTVIDSVNVYEKASKYVAENCDKLIVIWDGKETPLHDDDDNAINRGGTYDTYRKASKKLDSTSIHIIKCHR